MEGQVRGSGREQQPAGDTNALPDWVMKAAVSLFSAAGFLGMVAFTGGAILWARFYAAELPADQAVSVVPRDDLITLGATYLVGFAVVGAITVTLVYVLDPWGEPSGHTQFGLVVAATAGLVYATTQTERGDRRFVAAAAVGAAAVIALLALRSGELRRGRVPRIVLRRRRRRSAEKRHKYTRLRILGFVVGLGLIAFAAWLIDERWFGAVTVAAIALFALDLGIAEVTGDRFRWYGGAVFLSVGVFGAVMQTARTLDAEKLQAGAVLRKGDPATGGVAGFFIAETSDRVYLGRVDCARDRRGKIRPEKDSGRLIWFPKDQVAAVSVGPLRGVDAALQQGPMLLAELQSLRVEMPPSTPAGVAQMAASAQAPTPEDSRERPARPFGACPAPPQRWPPALQGTEVGGEQGRRIARQFRPLLQFDTSERWRPIGVEALLGEVLPGGSGGRHRHCLHPSKEVASCSDLDGIPSLEAAVGRLSRPPWGHLDLNGDDVDSYCAPRLCGDLPADCSACDESAIYYRVVAANGRFYIDYWWFLRFNFVRARIKEKGVCRAQLKPPRCFDHEGDWEGIAVVTTSGRPLRLEAATFGTHEKLIRHQPPGLRVIRGRPVVYIAAGTHAAYARPCPVRPSRQRCRQRFRLFGRLFSEGSHDGLRPWGRNPDANCFTGQPCLRPLPGETSGTGRSWNGWPGRWGYCERGRRRKCRFGEGPVAPRHQTRFRNPSCFHLPRPRRCDPVAAPPR